MVIITVIVFPVLFCHIPRQKQFKKISGEKKDRKGKRRREGNEGRREEGKGEKEK